MSEINLANDIDGLQDGRVARAHAALRMRASANKTYCLAADWIKYCLDVFLATTALIVLSPMLLMATILLLLVQGGPIFIAHRRIGQHGVIFPCFKLRTMVTNGDEVLAEHLAKNPEFRAEWQATQKLKDDPRVTPLGRIIRKNSIDEIPQLLNVIRGEMSLVGPRPIVAKEAEFYGLHFGHYIKVRPGLTGLWQVSGRSDTSYKTRVDLDVRYVSERSILGDVVIMAKTLPAVLSSRGSY